MLQAGHDAHAPPAVPVLAGGGDPLGEHPHRLIRNRHHALGLLLILLGRHDAGASSMPLSGRVLTSASIRATSSTLFPASSARTAGLAKLLR
jgi:hypothetical protein